MCLPLALCRNQNNCISFNHKKGVGGGTWAFLDFPVSIMKAA